jgi:hypothetical protein
MVGKLPKAGLGKSMRPKTYLINKNARRTGSMVQMAVHLPHQYETLSSNPSTIKTNKKRA